MARKNMNYTPIAEYPLHDGILDALKVREWLFIPAESPKLSRKVVIMVSTDKKVGVSIQTTITKKSGEQVTFADKALSHLIPAKKREIAQAALKIVTDDEISVLFTALPREQIVKGIPELLAKA